MDPPYRMAHKVAVTAADIINERDLLNDGGIFIVEHSSDLPFVTDVINMKLNRSCSYGLAVLTFFSKND
jgi:16S rRNA G966 N2-methylase RsmD